MAWWILVGTLAAFGVLCALWTMLGWLLPSGRSGTLIWFGEQGAEAFARRYLWLKGMGLIDCSLLLVATEVGDRVWMEDRGIEICTPEELPFRTGIGAEEN